MIPAELLAQLSSAYRVGEPIGSGSYGLVFRGESLADGEPVAIKTFIQQDAQQNSLNELKLLFRLRHPHVIRVLDLFYARKSYCLVFEYMESGDLRERMQEPLLEPEALVIAAQLADGLAYIHGQGIIHRDLKPENVLLRREGETMRCKLADFNLSKFTRTALTASNRGSPLYMAPEQFYDRYDGRADLYALGVMLYEMLRGHPPFEGNLQELMRAHLQQAPDLDAWPAGHGVRVLLAELLAKDPEQRPATAEQLRQRLRDLLAAHHSGLLQSAAPEAGRPAGAFYLKYLDVPLRRYCYYVLPEQGTEEEGL
ncbi:MAG: hypothetical protein CVV27_21060 [Candidatus Melainabacteria bacterium HGW-Melainabacteria-1]|nr:MAG: hypothetical protein CVV27_21060 [Candidatus Melainabacteria bacterium HGW-Melainabacteria-1]